MGQMFVEGKASKEYNCDVMVILFTFTDRNSTSACESSIFSDCEDFLHEMERIGIAPESFMTLDDSTSYKARDQWSEGGYTVSRKLMLKAKANLSLLEMILEVIRSRKYVVDYDVRYDISDERAINDELIRDAFADARRKADMIALATGQKVVGIIRTKVDREYGDWEEFDFDFDSGFNAIDGPVLYRRSESYFERLRTPKHEMSTTVQVVWEIS